MKARVATAGLAALLLFDVALVALAIRPSADVPTTPVVSGSPTSTVVATPTVTPSVRLTTSAYAPGPLTVMIVALDAKRAWRAQAGTCASGGALVQTTSNGGTTWTKGNSPAPTIARVQPLAGGSGFIYAANTQCVLVEHVTGDSGRRWSEGRQISGAWARNPKDANVVVTP